MRDLGELWQSYQAFRRDNWAYEKRAVIDGEIYNEDAIINTAKRAGLIEGDFTIGMCVCARFDISLIPKPDKPIPTNAKIEFQVRINGINGATDWVPFGTYYVGNRRMKNGIVSLECYDAMMFGNESILHSSDIEFDTPMTAFEALDKILPRLRVQLDPRNDLYDNFHIAHPNDYTMRELLGFIASAHGGNFCITDENTLRLMLPKNQSPLFNVTRSNAKDISQGDSYRYTRIQVTYGSSNDILDAGTGDVTLKISNPFASQSTLYSIYGIITGYTYNVADAISADIDLALELGDSISIDGVQVNLWSLYFTSRLYCDISTPTMGSAYREFSFMGSLSRRIDRMNSGYTITDENGKDYPKRSILQFDGVTIEDDKENKTTKLSVNGGYNITDSDGKEYPKRSTLQFEGATVEDDKENKVTKVTVGGGSGSSGHVIADKDGIEYPQRKALRFKGFELSDDEANNSTEVALSVDIAKLRSCVVFNHLPTQEESDTVKKGEFAIVYNPSIFYDPNQGASS